MASFIVYLIVKKENDTLLECRKAVVVFKAILNKDHIKHDLSHISDIENTIIDLNDFASEWLGIFPKVESQQDPQQIRLEIREFKAYKKNAARGGKQLEYARSIKRLIISMSKNLFANTEKVLALPPEIW